MYHHAPRPERPAGLGVVQDLAPRRRGRVAEADERERRLGEHRGRERQHRLRDDEVHDVGQDVPPHDPAGAGPDDPRPVDEHPLLERQDLAADDAGGRRPAGQADDDDDHEQGRADPEQLGLGSDDVEHDRREDQRQHDRRQDEEEVRHAHQQAVDHAADEARDDPDQRPDDDRDDRGQEADRHRDPRPVDREVEDVPAELVGAEPVLRRSAAASGWPVADVSVSSGPTNRFGNSASSVNTVRIAIPIEAVRPAEEAAHEVARRGGRSWTSRLDRSSVPGDPGDAHARTLGSR